MTREWKPGDVAVDGGGQRWFSVKASAVQNICWHSETGGAVGGNWPSLRPLVVIDPEDREQVEALLDCYVAPFGDFVNDVRLNHMQAALRSLADPKPEEPTGLGAVVEDADGRRWVLCEGGNYPWCRGVPDGSEWCAYADIAAVKVLSLGMTS